MEIMMRVGLPDRPGALAALAGVIGQAGGDIQAVEVVDHADGRALDDLVVWIDGPERLPALMEQVAALDDVELVHAGPSRGHPGDAVTRLAVGLGALLDTSMTQEHALVTLLGGLLRASEAEVLPAGDAPKSTVKTLVLPFGDQVVVARRDYRFTDSERERAVTILRTCETASALLKSLRGAAD